MSPKGTDLSPCYSVIIAFNITFFFSSLDRAYRHTFNEVFLEAQENNKHRDNSEHRTCYQNIKRIIISAELSSEAPTFNENWPSDISFYLNNVCVGHWTSPGDFGEVKGLLTPDWWYRCWNQYGLLKFIIIDDRGTFVDGLQISSVTISDLHLERGKSFPLRFAVNDDAENVDGLTIYGRAFGNYEQDINITLKY